MTGYNRLPPYVRERELLVRDRERRKRQLVRDLLDGVPIDPGQLPYALEQDHLGLVAWGDEPERVLLDVGEVTGLARLTVAGTDTTAWGWLGASSTAVFDDTCGNLIQVTQTR